MTFGLKTSSEKALIPCRAITATTKISAMIVSSATAMPSSFELTSMLRRPRTKTAAIARNAQTCQGMSTPAWSATVTLA